MSSRGINKPYCIVLYCIVLYCKRREGRTETTGDPHMRKIYEKACSEGTRKVCRTRIMLVGHYAAGKTSVKRSLLNEEFVSDYLPTKV